MKLLTISLLLLSIVGCKSVTPPTVITETKQGEVLTMSSIPEIGSRAEVPVEVAPRDVIKIETPTGGKVFIVKKLFHKPVAYTNEQGKIEQLKVTQPKDPWWKWPVLVLSAALVCGAIFIRMQFKTFFWWKH